MNVLHMDAKVCAPSVKSHISDFLFSDLCMEQEHFRSRENVHPNRLPHPNISNYFQVVFRVLQCTVRVKVSILNNIQFKNKKSNNIQVLGLRSRCQSPLLEELIEMFKSLPCKIQPLFISVLSTHRGILASRIFLSLVRIFSGNIQPLSALERTACLYFDDPQIAAQRRAKCLGTS